MGAMGAYGNPRPPLSKHGLGHWSRRLHGALLVSLDNVRRSFAALRYVVLSRMPA